jgi:hypothetical protein
MALPPPLFLQGARNVPKGRGREVVVEHAIVRVVLADNRASLMASAYSRRLGSYGSK